MKKTIELLILLAGSVSCLVHATNSTPSGILNIGDYYQGGVIYWLDSAKANKHGLIVDINDAPHSSAYAWDTSPPSKTQALDDKIYTGKNNTQLIISAIGSARAQAAYACVSSTSQGYSDWYLPSKYELELLLEKQIIITKAASA